MMTEQDSARAPFAAIRQRAAGVARVMRLPLRAGQWSGLNGQVFGLGTGNSLDFQDQRPYVPGDDPRHINWQAYARTGAYTMKLFRQEVSPRVDLIADLSPSMFLTAEKASRVWELVWFCIESALRLGASLRIHAILGTTVQEVPLDHAMADRWPEMASTEDSTAAGPSLDRVPVRGGALRVLISDLLFATAPDIVLTPLAGNRGRVIVLAPFCKDECDPDWAGNIEFEDSETRRQEKRRVPEAVLDRYRAAYQRHFDLWRESSVRRGAALARVGSTADLAGALRAEAVGAGAVEMA